MSNSGPALRVAEVLDAVEAVIQDDEIDLTDIDSPEKAKAAQLELVAHIRDQLASVLEIESEVEALRDVAAAARAVVRGLIPAVSAQVLEGSTWKHSRVSDGLTQKLGDALLRASKSSPVLRVTGGEASK